MIYTAFMAGFMFNCFIVSWFADEYTMALFNIFIVGLLLEVTYRRQAIFGIEKQIEILQEFLEKNAENKSKNKQ